MKQIILSLFVSCLIVCSLNVFAHDNPQNEDGKMQVVKKTSNPVVVVFNEASRVINVAFREDVGTVDELSVYNIIGNEVFDLQLERIGDKVFLIDAFNLKPGFYFLKIKTDKVEYLQRITVKPGAGQFSVSSKEFNPTFS
ncbi:MAG: T9SS type A sorting domain-containing protein [Bacteroidia bacterium]|nr:T9SS type A sorting domain-containing protein [Bacteroidia bacterium]